MNWYGFSIVSSSTADTASATAGYTGDSALYVPNITNAIYVSNSFATNHSTGTAPGYIPIEGKYSILVDNEQNIYLSGPAVTSSDNYSIIKLGYSEGNYTLSASYATSLTTISYGLALYEKTGEDTRIFQISRENNQSTSSINVFDKHLNLIKSFSYTSSIKAADLLDNIQVSPTKDLYLTTKIPARTIKYKNTGGDTWELQNYTHTFSNKINYF